MVMLLINLYGNQIWCRDSFQTGIDVCQIPWSCISINIVLQIWGGESPSSSDIESQLNSETQVSCYHFREKRTHFPGLTGSYDFDRTLALIDQY